jgi:hypothetical protein
MYQRGGNYTTEGGDLKRMRLVYGRHAKDSNPENPSIISLKEFMANGIGPQSVIRVFSKSMNNWKII